MKEIIGTGFISLHRYHLNGEVMSFGVNHPDERVRIPTNCLLNAGGLFSFVGISDGFEIENFEVMTNFSTHSFSGNLTMGFTQHRIGKDSINFNLSTAPFPTSFPVEVVVKLHYFEKASGLRFRSYFKANLREVYKPKHDVVYFGTNSHSEFSIINPHSHTYHSSEQGDPKLEKKLKPIPSSQKVEEAAFNYLEPTHQPRNLPGQVYERSTPQVAAGQHQAGVIPQDSTLAEQKQGLSFAQKTGQFTGKAIRNAVGKRKRKGKLGKYEKTQRRNMLHFAGIALISIALAGVGISNFGSYPLSSIANLVTSFLGFFGMYQAQFRYKGTGPLVRFWIAFALLVAALIYWN